MYIVVCGFIVHMRFLQDNFVFVHMCSFLSTTVLNMRQNLYTNRFCHNLNILKTAVSRPLGVLLCSLEGYSTLQNFPHKYNEKTPKNTEKYYDNIVGMKNRTP